MENSTQRPTRPRVTNRGGWPLACISEDSRSAMSNAAQSTAQPQTASLPDANPRGLFAGAALRRIGIFGHVGTGNLGDEAILEAAIQGVRGRCPQAELCGFSINPDDTRSRHGIPAFPIRRPRRVHGKL